MFKKFWIVFREIDSAAKYLISVLLWAIIATSIIQIITIKEGGLIAVAAMSFPICLLFMSIIHVEHLFDSRSTTVIITSMFRFILTILSVAVLVYVTPVMGHSFYPDSVFGPRLWQAYAPVFELLFVAITILAVVWSFDYVWGTEEEDVQETK